MKTYGHHLDSNYFMLPWLKHKTKMQVRLSKERSDPSRNLFCYIGTYILCTTKMIKAPYHFLTTVSNTHLTNKVYKRNLL